MENKKKLMAIALILVPTLTTGCGITITRNHYSTDFEQSVRKSKMSETQIEYPIDTLTNNKNG